MSIKEINAKFQKGELWSTMYIDSKKLESTPKEEANDPPKVNTNNNEFNKRKSISNLKFTNAVRRNTKAVIATKNLEPELPKKEEMLTMQIIPKKGLAKSSSESRYAILRKNISYIINVFDTKYFNTQWARIELKSANTFFEKSYCLLDFQCQNLREGFHYIVDLIFCLLLTHCMRYF